MLATSQTIAPKPALPPAAPIAQPSLPANTAGGPSFAQFLTEQAPPAQPDAEAAQDTGAETAQPAQAAAPRRATAAPKPAAQHRPSEATAKPEAKTLADKADSQARTDAVATGSDEEDASESPELKEFTQLLGMATPQPDAASAKPDPHRSRAAAAADDAAPGRAALRGVGDDGGRSAAETVDKRPAKAADLRADTARAARSGAETPETVAAATQSSSDPVPAAPAPVAPSFAAVLAQALPTPSATPEAAPATTYAGVQSPVQSQAFAPELGARVSLLAVDGVQQAELQLNPADMGPVSVQITVDGNQAQVSFHALQAETRQALEQSLPDLAAALQGQGLTLSGGGVFQQAPRDSGERHDRSDDSGPARSARVGSDCIGALPGTPPAPARRSVGLLDTFA